MGGEENLKKIQMIYEAFGRGDVQAVLDGVADDVDWATEASSAGAPWWGGHHGKQGVADFFQAFGPAMEVQEFPPYAFATTDNEVHTVVHCRATSRATGKAIDHDLHHYFRMDNGKIVFYRGTEDTAATAAALRA